MRNDDNELIEMRQIKLLLGDILRPRPAVYWFDFLFSISLGWTTFAVSTLPSVPTPLRVVSLILSSFLIYRCLFFNHEIAHINKPWVKAFALAWDFLCGAILFQPTSTYGISHLDHHKSNTFATVGDPRYVPLGLGTRKQWVLPMFTNIWIAPLMLAFRFLILGPISLVVGGKLRDWVVQNASTIAMNLKYVRELPNEKQKRLAMAHEVYCAAFWYGLIGLAAADVISWAIFFNLYILIVLHMAYNYLRALCAHRYTHSGDSVSFAEQLLDSITIPNPRSAARLFAPVGLSFHSLHHLLPSLPYHSMREAHRRLIDFLPQKHPYQKTFAAGMLEVLRDLWKRTESNRVQDNPNPVGISKENLAMGDKIHRAKVTRG